MLIDTSMTNRAPVCSSVTPVKLYSFAFWIILVYHGSKPVSADTELRRVYEMNMDYLPGRFKQLGLHGHMDFFPSNGDSSRPLYVPNDVTSPECLNHSRIYSDAIRDYKLWALKMLDASGKVPSGLLNGHYMDLGNYEECLSTYGEAPYDVNYCVVVMRNLTIVPKSPMDWDSDERKYTAGGGPFLRPYLRIGICLPASCDLNDLTQHYSNLTSKYNMSVYFDNLSCTPSDGRIKLEKLDWFAILLINFIIATCFVGTFYDVLSIYFNFKKTGTFVNILKCFSFYENGKSILETTSPEKPLSALHGLRALSTIWVVLGHHWILKHMFPVVNNIFLSTLYWSVTSDIFIHSERSVDTFFVMTGLLLVYTTMKSNASRGKFDVPSFYIRRLARIVPAYYVSILLILTLARFMNDGPLWNYYIHTAKQHCEQSWWTHVVFLNNYFLPNHQCSPHFWYLAVDMQLAVMSPLLLIPILKGKKIVIRVIVPALIVIANTISISITYFNDYPGTNLMDRLSIREDLFSTDYIPTHARMSPWLIGTLVGYFLSRDKIKLSKMQAVSGWIMSTLPIACIFTISRYLHSEGVEHNRILASIHNGLNSSAWAIFISWIIVACETGYAGPIRNFLSWPVFQPLSKISYSIYVVGLGFQYGVMSINQSSYSMLFIQTFKDFGGELFILLMTAPIYTLLFEAPFAKLHQTLTKNKKAKRKQKKAKDKCEEMDSKPWTNSTTVLTS